MSKFGVGDLDCLETEIRAVEDLKIHFNFLIDMFCFAIGLRVVCSGEG